MIHAFITGCAVGLLITLLCIVLVDLVSGGELSREMNALIERIIGGNERKGP